MKRRCANPRAAFAYRYSERGITVCQRWRSSFEAFLADLGRRPEGAYSLDRRDNNAGYTCGACPECAANGWPMNCRWASNFEQSVNKETTARVYVFGADVSIRRLAKIFALNSKTVKGRLRRGWPVERALTTPVTQTRRWHARDAA